MAKKTPPIDIMQTVDLSLGLGKDILDIVKDNMPTRDEKRLAAGLRKLKHKFKKSKIDVFVRANFDDYTEERQLEIIAYYKGLLGRD